MREQRVGKPIPKDKVWSFWSNLIRMVLTNLTAGFYRYDVDWWESSLAVLNQLSLFPLQPLDYESKRAYTLKVEATNVRFEPSSGGPFKDTATVKIVVEDADEPPVFSKPMYSLEVNENAPINTVIGTVNARDPDSTASSVRYANGFSSQKKPPPRHHCLTVCYLLSRAWKGKCSSV